MRAEELAIVDDTVRRLGRRPDAVIPILQALQEQFRFLPEEALWRVCETTDITPASIWGIATFYDQFRHHPVGRHIVHVCHGTACHVNGAERINEALRLRLGIPQGKDTDPAGGYTIEPVACLGCCTLAPVIRLGDATYGHATPERLPQVLNDFEQLQALAATGPKPAAPTPDHRPLAGVIKIGLGSCCTAKGSDRLFDALRQAAAESGASVAIKRVGCVGMCHRTPLVEVAPIGQPVTLYSGVEPARARQLIRRHFHPPGLLQRASRAWSGAIDRWLLHEGEDIADRHALDTRAPAVHAFLGKQHHIATEHFGDLDPLDLQEYLAHQGFQALRRCLTEFTPDQIIDQVIHSGLRGRGGAGFPTGPKWRLVRHQPDPVKYVICNGDEGDPGAFMDRMLLESFPYRIIEGLAMAAVAVGAHEGFFYVRREYPLAVRRLTEAIAECERRGWLGDKLLGLDYPLKLSIKEGAGAFVCGEETALIASIQGERGMPRLRPPFPAESGLWGKPTVINNVETLALLPWILRHGPAAFAAIGTPSSKGTKVFALAGKIRRGGLIEVPMGITLREIVEEIGGGVASDRCFKAVQIGGPSGGCIPARLADTPVDFESLRQVGAIMGSGGLVVLDDSDCMVDIARYFLQFTQEQSCGKCTFCRIGTRRMLDLLEAVCHGNGRKEHLAELESLAHSVSLGSLCGLGKTAPNPVLTTLKYFRDEYEAHLAGRCPAAKCRALIRYRITDECTGCTLCAQNCPVQAIPLVPYQHHTILQDRCTRCDTCRQVCPYNAVAVA